MMHYIKNLNRYEILGVCIGLVVLYYVLKIIIGVFQKSQRREEAQKDELIHIEAKYWPTGQLVPKFLELCRRGKMGGAVAQHGTNPILVLANDEYIDWDAIPETDRQLLERAHEVWTFDPGDHDSRIGASNRILQLDRKILKLNHGSGDQTKQELTTELKRTILFIIDTCGINLGREVAKAALPTERKHLVDNFFDAIAIVAREQKRKARTQPTGVTGYEIDPDN